MFIFRSFDQLMRLGFLEFGFVEFGCCNLIKSELPLNKFLGSASSSALRVLMLDHSLPICCLISMERISISSLYVVLRLSISPTSVKFFTDSMIFGFAKIVSRRDCLSVTSSSLLSYWLLTVNLISVSSSAIWLRLNRK